MNVASRDEILRKFAAMKWTYADKDHEARRLLADRIEQAGGRGDFITYSKLVEDVVFHLPNINNGDDYRIHTYDWSGLDRRIIGDFLGHISMESYQAHDFFASALVVSAEKSKSAMPSRIFFQWMETLNVIPDLSENSVLRFWTEQTRKAFDWYANGEKVGQTDD